MNLENTPFAWSINKKNENDNYMQISRQFIENYCIDFSQSIASLEKYYTTNSKFTIIIRKNNIEISRNEIIGFDKIKNKLYELGIGGIFSEINFISQPIGIKRVLISSNGKISINASSNHTVIITYIIKCVSTQWKIDNHIFEIYL